MDPKGTGTVAVELNATAAHLLASLCVELGEEDPVGVISRALGLLDLSIRMRKQGGRLLYENARGETSDVVL